MKNVFQVLALGLVASSFSAFANPTAAPAAAPVVETKKVETSVQEVTKTPAKKISHKEASKACLKDNPALKENKAELKNCIKGMRKAS